MGKLKIPRKIQNQTPSETLIMNQTLINHKPMIKKTTVNCYRKKKGKQLSTLFDKKKRGDLKHELCEFMKDQEGTFTFE